MGTYKIGIIPSFLGIQVSNDLWGDKGDRYRTSHQQINLGFIKLGAIVFTGDPGLNEDDRETAKEPRAAADLYYVRGRNGEDPDKYRAGIFYVGFGSFRFGWDSEDNRHFFQNIIGHNIISRNSPWFKYIWYKPKFYFQFGGGMW